MLASQLAYDQSIFMRQRKTPSNKDNNVVTNKHKIYCPHHTEQLGWDLKMEIPLRENLKENLNTSSDYF